MINTIDHDKDELLLNINPFSKKVKGSQTERKIKKLDKIKRKTQRELT